MLARSGELHNDPGPHPIMGGGIEEHILLLPVKKARPVKAAAAATAYATNSGLTAYTPATSKAEGMRAVPTLKLDIVRGV